MSCSREGLDKSDSAFDVLLGLVVVHKPTVRCFQRSGSVAVFLAVWRAPLRVDVLERGSELEESNVLVLEFLNPGTVRVVGDEVQSLARVTKLRLVHLLA